MIISNILTTTIAWTAVLFASLIFMSLHCSLTVEEHLYFYGCLKGMKSESASEEINRMIADVGLPHKRTALAKELSGKCCHSYELELSI